MPVWYRVCVTRLSERPSEASRGRKVVDCKDTARLKTNGLERDVGTSLFLLSQGRHFTSGVSRPFILRIKQSCQVL